VKKGDKQRERLLVKYENLDLSQILHKKRKPCGELQYDYFGARRQCNSAETS
jgi:hypothetical protein